MDDFPHILIDKADEHDCRFISSWFAKIADAQTYWQQILCDPSLAEAVLECCCFSERDLGIAAGFILELEQEEHVASINLEEASMISFELAIMAQLGLLVSNGQIYRLAIPESITMEKVQAAAAQLLSTVIDLGFGPVSQPELLLHTLSGREAEVLRSKLAQARHSTPTYSADTLRGAAAFGTLSMLASRELHFGAGSQD